MEQMSPFVRTFEYEDHAGILTSGLQHAASPLKYGPLKRKKEFLVATYAIKFCTAACSGDSPKRRQLGTNSALPLGAGRDTYGTLWYRSQLRDGSCQFGELAWIHRHCAYERRWEIGT